MRKYNITKLWVRFMKENNIYYSVMDILIGKKKVITNNYLKELMPDNDYEEFFQSTCTFCNWSDTIQGFTFWSHISTTWIIHLYCLGFKIDNDISEYFEDYSIDDLEELKLKYLAIEKNINEEINYRL